MNINYLDILILIVFIIGAIEGASRGFLISFFNIASLVASIYLSSLLMPFLGSILINKTELHKTLETAFASKRSGGFQIQSIVAKILNIKSNTTIGQLTDLFIYIGCFICMFIILSVIINIIRDYFIPSVKRGKLKKVDRFGGTLIGIVKMYLIIGAIFSMIIPITVFMSKETNVSQVLFTSRFCNFFIKNNIIFFLFRKLTL